MNLSGSNTFVRRLASCVAALIAIHIVICIYFTVTPRSYPLHHTFIGSAYRRIFLIGPFYIEKRISISPSLYIRYKTNGGEWSAFANYGENLHQEYYASPWRYDRLNQDNLIRFLMRKAFDAKIKHSYDPAYVSNTKQFCRLNTFIVNELICKENIDSVNLVYNFSSFVKEQSTFKVDTVWNITFNPGQICAIH